MRRVQRSEIAGLIAVLSLGLISAFFVGARTQAGAFNPVPVPQHDLPAPTLSLSVPIELHNLPREIDVAGYGCILSADGVILGYSDPIAPEAIVAGTLRRTVDFVVRQTLNPSIAPELIVCGLGMRGTVAGHRVDFGRYRGGNHLETSPYDGRTQMEVEGASAANCITAGAAVTGVGTTLSLTGRLCCYGSVTTSSCPCGCGDTG